MLKAKVTVDQIGKEVVAFLLPHIRVNQLIAFGSYAYGHPREDSDFDMAVISEDLEKMNILEKIELFARVALAVDSRIELKGFSAKEFQNPQKGSLLEMIKRRGKVVYENS